MLVSRQHTGHHRLVEPFTNVALLRLESAIQDSTVGVRTTRPKACSRSGRLDLVLLSSAWQSRSQVVAQFTKR